MQSITEQSPPPRPLLVVLLGLSASGKSTFARCIRNALHKPLVLDADTILVPGKAEGKRVSSERDRYGIYASMADLARAALLRGRDVIWIQALTMERAHESHPQPAGRVGLVALAEFTRSGIAFLHLDAPMDVLTARLRRRRRASRTGESWLRVLQRMHQAWEPILQDHLLIDTSRLIHHEETLSFLRAARFTTTPAAAAKKGLKSKLKGPPISRPAQS